MVISRFNDRHQSIFSKLVAGFIKCLTDPVGKEHKRIAWLQLDAGLFVRCERHQAHDGAAAFQSLNGVSSEEQGWVVTCIYINAKLMAACTARKPRDKSKYCSPRRRMMLIPNTRCFTTT